MKEDIAQDIANECMAFSVRRVTRLVSGFYDSYMSAVNLRHTQFTLLVAMRVLNGSTVNELAGALLIDRTTLTRNLSLLEEAGFVAKSPGEDRRTRIYTITEKGNKKLDHGVVLWAEAQSALKSKLGNSGYRKVMQAMDLLEEGLSETHSSA